VKISRENRCCPTGFAPEAEARDALASLPLVEEGLIIFEVILLVPHDGFARLFVGPYLERARQRV
jgi:hypothetical protein